MVEGAGVFSFLGCTADDGVSTKVGGEVSGFSSSEGVWGAASPTGRARTIPFGGVDKKNHTAEGRRLV